MTFSVAFGTTKLPDGQIEPDSEVGKQLGFTSDKFEGWLWKTGEEVMISMIISLKEGHGNLSALFKAIEDRGLRIAVPTPFARMRSILKRRGFRPSRDLDAVMGPVEVWRRPL